MARLIDAIAYCKVLREEMDYLLELDKTKGFNTLKERLGLEVAIADLGDMPTVDAVEVVHGEWIEDYETFVDDSGKESYPIQTGYVCSECGVDGSPVWRYCPYCGAKMRG